MSFLTDQGLVAQGQITPGASQNGNTYSRDGQQYTSDYFGNQDFTNLFNNSINSLAGAHSDDSKNRNLLLGNLNNTVGSFASQFENLVGRAPTQDETNQFIKQNLGSSFNAGNGTQNLGTQDIAGMSNNLQQYIGQNFQKAAQDYATQQLTAQQGQANSLADLFRTQGNAAISDTENSLLDYQSKLFDRLRPNLMTSLQSQGLLDTGGMNEAVAGVQGDLANNASNYIAQLKYQNDQGANQIAFGGASAPYYYKQGLIGQQPNNVMNAGNAGAAFNNATFMDNLNYQHQLGLMGYQAQINQDAQPSFMRTFGQGIAGGLGGGLGQGGAMFANGALFGSKQGSSGSGAASAAPAYAALA